MYFNRPITLVDMSGDTAPVVALRIMDHNGNGVVIDGISQVVGSTGQVPQWNATEVKVDEADSTKMIVSFGDLDISLILKELTMPQHLSAAGDVAFFFEERNPGVTEQGDTYVGNNHLIHHIRDAVTGKQFDITEFTTHNYAHIIDFDIQYMDPAIDEVTIDDVKVINQSQIVVTFSEQVVIDNATIEKMPVAIIQLVDDIYGYKRTDDGVIWGWKGYLNYYNDAHTQLVFSLLKDGNANLPMPGLDDIAALMDEQYDRMVLGIVDNNANDGVVNAINTTTGHRLLADPFNGRADIVYCEVDVDQIPQGELTIINAEAISDMDIILTFSDAVSIEDNPFLAIRMYNEKNLLLYKTSNGEYVTRGTTDGVKNTPMQWSMSWEWCDEKHTQIKCKITSTPGLTPNLTEMFNHDWEKEYAGCKIWIGFEENNASLVAKNSYVDNITLASNSGVSLTGNVWTADGKRAGAFISITPGYTIKKVTASAKILNDTDIRITFSAPVDFIGEPYMGVRLVEEGYNLIKLGDEYNVVYMQYSGKWTWEDDSHTSILWRMNGDGAGGANNLADVVNYKNVLRMLKGKRITFCIEEKTTNNVISAKANGLIDNILAKDKQNHLTVNKPSTNGYDGLYMDLNTGLLKDRAELELLSVKAIDDQTVELTFSEAVFLAEGELAPTLVIQYLNKSGNTETFTDGRTASFNGTISYKDNTKTVLVWKLNSKQTKSLTSVFNFEDNLKWNFGARIVFVVSDAKDNAMPSKCGLINGITSLDGVRRLSCNIGSGKIQRDIEVSYDLPERITDVGTDKNKDTIEYVSNYAVYMIVAIVTVVIVSVAALCVKPKKKEEK